MGWIGLTNHEEDLKNSKTCLYVVAKGRSRESEGETSVLLLYRWEKSSIRREGQRFFRGIAISAIIRYMCYAARIRHTDATRICPHLPISAHLGEFRKRKCSTTQQHRTALLFGWLSTSLL